MAEMVVKPRKSTQFSFCLRRYIEFSEPKRKRTYCAGPKAGPKAGVTIYIFFFSVGGGGWWQTLVLHTFGRIIMGSKGPFRIISLVPTPLWKNDFR